MRAQQFDCAVRAICPDCNGVHVFQPDNIVPENFDAGWVAVCDSPCGGRYEGREHDVRLDSMTGHHPKIVRAVTP